MLHQRTGCDPYPQLSRPSQAKSNAIVASQIERPGPVVDSCNGHIQIGPATSYALNKQFILIPAFNAVRLLHNKFMRKRFS